MYKNLFNVHVWEHEHLSYLGIGPCCFLMTVVVSWKGHIFLALPISSKLGLHSGHFECYVEKTLDCHMSSKIVGVCFNRQWTQLNSNCKLSLACCGQHLRSQYRCFHSVPHMRSGGQPETWAGFKQSCLLLPWLTPLLDFFLTSRQSCLPGQKNNRWLLEFDPPPTPPTGGCSCPRGKGSKQKTCEYAYNI